MTMKYSRSAGTIFRLRVRLALMKECTVKYKQTTVKMASIVARWWSAKWSLWYWRTRDDAPAR